MCRWAHKGHAGQGCVRGARHRAASQVLLAPCRQSWEETPHGPGVPEVLVPASPLPSLPRSNGNSAAQSALLAVCRGDAQDSVSTWCWAHGSTWGFAARRGLWCCPS